MVGGDVFAEILDRLGRGLALREVVQGDLGLLPAESSLRNRLSRPDSRLPWEPWPPPARAVAGSSNARRQRIARTTNRRFMSTSVAWRLGHRRRRGSRHGGAAART